VNVERGQEQGHEKWLQTTTGEISNSKPKGTAKSGDKGREEGGVNQEALHRGNGFFYSVNS